MTDYESEITNSIARMQKLERENNAKVGIIRDADTVLADIISEADFCVNGLGDEIIKMRENCSDKRTFDSLFYALTDCTFNDYINKVISALENNK